MGPVIGDILPFAIGVAISPVPIIAVILMLFSERAGQNGPAFLVGWLVGLTGAVVIVLLVAGGAGADSGTSSTLASWLKVGLGVLLIVLGARRWRTRPHEGETAKQPAWMATIDSLQPSRALLFGVLLSAINPKNLTLAVGSAVVIAQAGLGVGESAVAAIVFVLLGSVSILVPVVYAFAGGESARRTLDGWKSWLSVHDAAVMAVLLVVLGTVLAGKGLGSLIG